MNGFRLESFSLITICFNFASPKPFYKVDKYIENFEYVTDDSYSNKVTEDPFKRIHYFDSPKRNLAKNINEEYEAVKKEYLKELKEETAYRKKLEAARRAKPQTKGNEITEVDEMRPKDDKLLNRMGCGADNTGTTKVVEGPADIESFPWLGVLIYPRGKDRLITTVVLVTRNTVIGSALDIEKLPKIDFRKKSKVVLGQTCKYPGINVLDYNYHPDYGKDTFSSLVLIQIDLDNVTQVLWPICGPPKLLEVSKFYTITLPSNCRKSQVEIFSMDYVKQEVCKHYYRRTGLDIDTIWPKHGACGRAHTEDECLWRNGAALVVKQAGRWHLMGFGVNGPGCAAPSRYIDYVAYSNWVDDSVAGIGRPALTRMADNELILRRSADKIQRYGPCDTNEVQFKLFCDVTNATNKDRKFGRIRYNLTLIEDYDYTCIFIQATSRFGRPKLSMKGVCDSPHPICYSASRFQLDFYIEIMFVKEVWYRICAYGREIRVADPKGKLKYFNMKVPPVHVPNPFTRTNHPPMYAVFWEFSTYTTDDNTWESTTGTDRFVTPTTFIDNETEIDTEPRLPSGDEFSLITPIVNETDTSVKPTDDGFWSHTPIMDGTDKPFEPTGGEFWSITPIGGNETDTPFKPSGGEFWSVPPIETTDDESYSSSPEEPSGEFWSITPIATGGVELPSPKPKEPSGEFWSVTPVATIGDDELSSPKPKEPSDKLWSVIPIATTGDDELSYTKPMESSGEFWSMIPIATTGDDELSSPKPKEPSGKFWSVAPIVTTGDDDMSYTKPTESFGEFWSMTLNDDELSSPKPKEPSSKFWSVAPIVTTGDDELSSPKPKEPSDDFWSVTPIATTGDDELSYTKPMEPSGEELLSPNPKEPSDEFWSVTLIATTGDDEVSSPKPKEPSDGYETDKLLSPKQTVPSDEFWSHTPIATEGDEKNPKEPIEPTKGDVSESPHTNEPKGDFQISTERDEPSFLKVGRQHGFWNQPIDDAADIGETGNTESSVVEIDEAKPWWTEVSVASPNLPKNKTKEVMLKATKSDRKDVTYHPLHLWRMSTPVQVSKAEPVGAKDTFFEDITPLSYDEIVTTKLKVPEEEIRPALDVDEYFTPINDIPGGTDEYDPNWPLNPVEEKEDTQSYKDTDNVVPHKTALSDKKGIKYVTKFTMQPWWYVTPIDLDNKVEEVTDTKDVVPEDSLPMYDEMVVTRESLGSEEIMPINGVENVTPLSHVPVNKEEYGPDWTEIPVAQERDRDESRKPVEPMLETDNEAKEVINELENWWTTPKSYASFNKPLTPEKEILQDSTLENKLSITSFSFIPPDFGDSLFGTKKMVSDKEVTSAKTIVQTPIDALLEEKESELEKIIHSIIKITVPPELVPSSALTKDKFKDKIELLDYTPAKAFGKLNDDIDFDVTSPKKFGKLKDNIDFDVTSLKTFGNFKDNIDFDVTSPKTLDKLKDNVEFDVTSTKMVNTKEFLSVSQGAGEDKLESFENQFEDILDLARVTNPSKQIEMTSTKTIYESLNAERGYPKIVPNLDEILSVTAATVPAELDVAESKIESQQKEVDVGTEDILRMVKLRLGNKYYGDRFMKPHGFDTYRQPTYFRNVVTRRRQKITESPVLVF